MRRLKLDEETIEAALNCLSACADDPRESQRYSQWYWESYKKLQREAVKRGYTKGSQ